MFPKETEATVKNLPFTKDDVGRSEDTVYNFNNQYILKISDNTERLRAEKDRFDYLSEYGIPGSKSISFVTEKGKSYYLRTCIAGDSLIHERFISNPELLTDVLADIVKILRSLDNKNCPFASADNKGKEFVHGDLCLPNIYVDENNEFAGFIDLDNAGLGDRWYDYSWLLWSLEYNLGTDKYNDMLLGKIGEKFSREKFDMYIPEDFHGKHYEQ